jgi:hypothetical protein
MVQSLRATTECEFDLAGTQIAENRLELGSQRRE